MEITWTDNVKMATVWRIEVLIHQSQLEAIYFSRLLTIQILLSSLIEDICQVATSTVLAIVHGSHENTGTALILSLALPD
jgi:hypothetical protein